MSRLPTGHSLQPAATASAVAGFLVGLALLFGEPAVVPASAQGQTAKQPENATPRVAFTLSRHDGRVVTQKEFGGRHMLISFGYTYCPDVCPTGLQTMSAALDELGERGDMVVPVFVTIDPERDTVEVLSSYVSHFHPRLVGLRGSAKQTRSAARIFGARYFKVFPPPFDSEDGEEDAGDTGNDENMDYLMSHSASTYLVGPDLGLLQTFAHGISAAEMAWGIAQSMESR